MGGAMDPPREKLVTAAGVLGLFTLLVLPLMALALLDILQGHEDLTLEWVIVGIGFLFIAAAQIATLALLWWPGSRTSSSVHTVSRSRSAGS